MSRARRRAARGRIPCRTECRRASADPDRGSGGGSTGRTGGAPRAADARPRRARTAARPGPRRRCRRRRRPPSGSPPPGAARSITAPHRGAPSALPTVDIVPLQPMTSPRRPSGTSRTSVALIDDSAGAHGSPATTTATASQPGRATKAAGTVASARIATSTAATASGARVPWIRPPITDPPAHSAIIQPTSCGRPASLSVATSDTSVPTRTNAAATPASSTTTSAGRQQPTGRDLVGHLRPRPRSGSAGSPTSAGRRPGRSAHRRRSARPTSTPAWRGAPRRRARA